MKRYEKHIFALLLAAVLTFSMTGCSTAAALLLHEAEPTATPEPVSTPEPIVTPEPMPESTAEPDEPEVPATPIPGRIEITEENYQLLFAPAPDFAYIGIAYMKAPEAYGKFIDAYLPYGDTLEYLEGGYAVQSTAHGMRVYETMAEVAPENTAEDAIQVLMERYVAQAEFAGEEVAEISDVNYYEEYDIAIQAGYTTTADGGEHYTILVADIRETGYYFCAMITYLPEQYDDEQPALLAELSDVFGLELPEI